MNYFSHFTWKNDKWRERGIYIIVGGQIVFKWKMRRFPDEYVNSLQTQLFHAHTGKVYMNVMTAYAGRQNENKYDLPGGTDDKPGGESQECVAYRETCEEAGFKVNLF